jgi:hypothetical protein
MPHNVVLSGNVDAGYPQLSSVPEADRTVIPGLQAAASVGAAALQVDPMLPLPVVVQSLPVQQRLGPGEGCGVHVRPGAQLPVESQRQPCVPTMHVAVTPSPPEVADDPAVDVDPDRDVVLPESAAETPLPPPLWELLLPALFDGEAPHADAANPAIPAPQRNPRTLLRHATIRHPLSASSRTRAREGRHFSPKPRRENISLLH